MGIQDSIRIGGKQQLKMSSYMLKLVSCELVGSSSSNPKLSKIKVYFIEHSMQINDI